MPRSLTWRWYCFLPTAFRPAQVVYGVPRPPPSASQLPDSVPFASATSFEASLPWLTERFEPPNARHGFSGVDVHDAVARVIASLGAGLCWVSRPAALVH